jgi:hypothetical protein
MRFKNNLSTFFLQVSRLHYCRGCKQSMAARKMPKLKYLSKQLCKVSWHRMKQLVSPKGRYCKVYKVHFRILLYNNNQLALCVTDICRFQNWKRRFAVALNPSRKTSRGGRRLLSQIIPRRQTVAVVPTTTALP